MDAAILQLARDITADVAETPGMADRYRAGEFDRHLGVRAAYAALVQTRSIAPKHLFAEEMKPWTARDVREERDSLADELRRLWRYLDERGLYRGDDQDNGVVDQAIAAIEERYWTASDGTRPDLECKQCGRRTPMLIHDRGFDCCAQVPPSPHPQKDTQ